MSWTPVASSACICHETGPMKGDHPDGIYCVKSANLQASPTGYPDEDSQWAVASLCVEP